MIYRYIRFDRFICHVRKRAIYLPGVASSVVIALDEGLYRVTADEIVSCDLHGLPFNASNSHRTEELFYSFQVHKI